MTPERAALTIQRAWRSFDHDRKCTYYQAYEDELNDMYYRDCYDPGDWDYDMHQSYAY
jgi:hypothetical protein